MDEARQIASAIEANEFLNSFLRVYAVSTLGFFIFAGLNRIANAASHGTTDEYQIVPNTGDSGTDSSDDENDSDEPTTPDLYPVNLADHDVNADLRSAFTIYHVDTESNGVKYLIMRYDQPSTSFSYWCDITPSWETLQTCARKFVTEHRCAALYSSSEVTTETETQPNMVATSQDTSVSSSDKDGSSSTDDNGTQSGNSEAANESSKKSLTTKVDNIYVRMGRVDAFRTAEKEIPKNTTIDYKMFASIRARTGLSS